MEYIWGMKKIALLVFCFFLFKGYGQNLVPNPSFELYDTCPFSAFQISFSQGWYSPTTGIAAYINQCSVNGEGVPLNYWSFQYARTGVAYAVIDCYETDLSSGLSDRVYIQTQLSDTLKGGKDYCISFYVNLTNGGISFNPNSNLIAVDKIGMYLSSIAIQSNDYNPLFVNPQIVSTQGVFLNDTVNWMQISGIYTANGGEKYITIGNFSTDANTDTMYLINNHAQHNKALYNIDDISVVQCNVGIDEANAEVSSFNLSPNPNNGQMTLSYHLAQAAELSIYDMQGRRLITYTLPPNNQTLNLNLEELNAGIYYYSLHTHDKQLKTEKLVIVK